MILYLRLEQNDYWVSKCVKLRSIYENQAILFKEALSELNFSICFREIFVVISFLKGLQE